MSCVNNLSKALKLISVLFLIILSGNNFSQEVKYIFHEKENLVPLTSLNKEYSENPLTTKLSSKVISHPKSKLKLSNNINSNDLSLQTTISGVDIIANKNSNKNHVHYNLVLQEKDQLPASELASIPGTSQNTFVDIDVSAVSIIKSRTKTRIIASDLVDNFFDSDNLETTLNDYENDLFIENNFDEVISLNEDNFETDDSFSDEILIEDLTPSQEVTDFIDDQITELFNEGEVIEENSNFLDETKIVEKNKEEFNSEFVNDTEPTEDIKTKDETLVDEVIDEDNSEIVVDTTILEDSTLEKEVIEEDVFTVQLNENTIDSLDLEEDFYEEELMVDDTEENQLSDFLEDEQTEEIFLAEDAEAELFDEISDDDLELKRLAEEAEAEQLAEKAEAESEDQRLAAEAELQRLAEEAEAQRLAEEAEAQRLAAEAEAQRLAEEAESQGLASEAEAQRLAEEAEAQRLAEEAEAQRLVEEAEVQRLAEEAEVQRLAEEAEVQRLAEEAEAQRLVEEAEAKRLAEEAEAQRLAAEAESQRLAAEAESQRLAEEAEVQRLAEEAEAQRLAEEAEAQRLAKKAEAEKLKQNYNTIKSNSRLTNEKFPFTADNVFETEDLTTFYTIKLKTVNNPSEGIRFLTNARDGDPLWDDYAFHLYKDKDNPSLTNISIGKFADMEKANEIIQKVKNKGMGDAVAIKYEKDLHEPTANKSASTPKVNNTIVSNQPKPAPYNKSKVIPAKPVSKPSNNQLTNKPIEKSNTQPVFKPVNSSNTSSKSAVVNEISTNINSDVNFFTVQIASVKEISPDRINQVNLNKKDLFYSNISNSSYAMNYGKYPSYELAHKEALQLKSNGVSGAFVSKYINNKRIKVALEDLKSENLDPKLVEKDMKPSGYKPVNPNYSGKYVQIGTFYNWDAHGYDDSFKNIESTIYYQLQKNNAVKFFVGPFEEQDVYIELRKIKKLIPDAFIKTL